MRSGADLIRLAVLAAACAAGAARAQDAAAPPPAAASAASAPGTGGDQRAARIEKAVDDLRADPLLSGKHMEKRPRWIDDDEPAKKKLPVDSSLLGWLAALGRFLSDTSRFLLWGGVAVLVALLLVSARHLVNLRAFERRAKADAAVSHVRDLDVRPESLPDDVGAAAWALWQAGRVQDALSLLYRGALSRLIHKYRVPITSSATEGECLELARAGLETPTLRYVTQVVRAWEASIYGGRALSLAMGEALCTGFGERLDGRASAGGAA
ncbi:MAG: DUF4129 domain-containing protein [Burkholderiales bacterium]|nr:DUF4129 domain-containing protein [Burkholderiales bacterium]